MDVGIFKISNTNQILDFNYSYWIGRFSVQQCSNIQFLFLSRRIFFSKVIVKDSFYTWCAVAQLPSSKKTWKHHKDWSLLVTLAQFLKWASSNTFRQEVKPSCRLTSRLHHMLPPALRPRTWFSVFIWGLLPWAIFSFFNLLFQLHPMPLFWHHQSHKFCHG